MIDEHFNKSERTKARIDTLFVENQDMAQQIEETRRSYKAVEGQVRDKVKRNEELKARLMELWRNQERVAEALDRVKADKARRQALFEEKMERLVRSRQEADKLRPYMLESPASLQASLTELSESLLRDKAQVDAMEKRARALQTSSDTFTVVGNDVQACIRALDDVSAELQKEEDEESRASRNRDAISEKGNNVREVEQTEQLLQRQLAKWNERIEVLRRNAHEKAVLVQGRMEELREVQNQLREERTDKQRDMERRRIRIEQTEKKVGFQMNMDVLKISRWQGKLTSRLLDGRSQREHRERDPQCTRPVSAIGIAHKALHHGDGEMSVSLGVMSSTKCFILDRYIGDSEFMG